MIVPLGILDMIILVGAFASAVVIGLQFRGQDRSIEAYLLGDRNLPWWAILGSIVATETSTATVLSVPGYGYGETKLRFLQLALGFILGRILVVAFLLPKYFEGELLSAYEVLGTRFGVWTKKAASLLFLITRNLGDGLRLFLAAMVLEKLAGWPMIASAFAIGGVTILYTFFGGMRSVVWNDCVQFVIYMVGSLAALMVIVWSLPEGWQTFIGYAESRNDFRWLDFSFRWDAPFNLWAGLVGGATLSLGSHGTDQMMVQRYLSARSQRDAARAIVMSGVVVFLQFALFLLIGMLLDCYFSLQNSLPQVKNDEIFAHFMIHHFPKNTGMIGLMLAAILAAAMSTLSSSLSSSASAVISDWLLPRFAEAPSQASLVRLTRWITVGFGILQIAVGIWASHFDESVVTNALTIAGFASGVLLGLFALALLTDSAKDFLALMSAAAGLLVLLVVQFGLPLWNIKVAFPWIPVIGAMTTVLVGLGLNALDRRRSLGTTR